MLNRALGNNLRQKYLRDNTSSSVSLWEVWWEPTEDYGSTLDFDEISVQPVNKWTEHRQTLLFPALHRAGIKWQQMQWSQLCPETWGHPTPSHTIGISCANLRSSPDWTAELGALQGENWKQINKQSWQTKTQQEVMNEWNTGLHRENGRGAQSNQEMSQFCMRIKPICSFPPPLPSPWFWLLLFHDQHQALREMMGKGGKK